MYILFAFYFHCTRTFESFFEIISLPFEIEIILIQKIQNAGTKDPNQDDNLKTRLESMEKIPILFVLFV